MPRKARIDIPDLLHHVMARGDGQDLIFRDELDYTAFLERLSIVLEETRTKCYAWVLLPNHFHLLLRPSVTPLSKVMRRLMTGYAVSFNKKNERKGPLFQNRYKSIVCEDIYLKELAAYIHLNPIRIGIVSDLGGLDRYPWSGHSVLVGKRKNPFYALLPERLRAVEKAEEKPPVEDAVKEFLSLFGDSPEECRRRYRQFMKKRVHQGMRPDLMGGGGAGNSLVNGSGEFQTNHGRNHFSDHRVLGNSDFVLNAIRKEQENKEKKWQERKMNTKLSLSNLMKKACADADISIKTLTSSKRDQKTSYVRAVISFLAVVELRYTITKIARELRLSANSVSRCVVRGKKIAESDRKIFNYIKS